jgi:hypothetical protein
MRGVFISLLAAAACQAGPVAIVDCNLRELEGGKRLLEAKVASTAGTPLDVRRVQMKVCFFERGEGQVLPGEPEPVFQWTSLPVNWRKGGPESFAVYYPGPRTGSGRSYGGWAVAVYFDGQLQDVQSSRKSLVRKFPFSETFVVPQPKPEIKPAPVKTT